MRTFALLLVLSFLLPLDAFSQKTQVGGFYLPQITSISNSLSDKGDPIYKNKITFAGGGGVSLTYWFKNHLGVQTGLTYVSHNQKFVSSIRITDDSIRTWKGKKRLDYLKVPLLLTFTNLLPYKRDSRIAFTMAGGVQLGYLLKGDGAIVIFQHYQYDDYYDLPESGSEYYSKFVADLVISVGLDFILTKNLAINTAVRADWSITDVENKNATHYNNVPTYYYSDPNRRKGHNSSLGLLLGLTYSFGSDHLLNPSQKW